MLRYIKEKHSRGGVLLAKAHEEGAGGLELTKVRSKFIDALLRLIWGQAVLALQTKEDGLASPVPCAMFPIGGYGRGELSPFSDIDLLFIFPKRTTEVSNFVRTVLYLLWDAGLVIGHSARSVPECLRYAREDFHNETAMLEHRFVAGSEAVTQEFERRYEAYLLRAGKGVQLRRRLQEQGERYRLWDPSVYVQEPNIKESAGGLRDFHVVLWLARSLFGAKNLEKIHRAGLSSEAECGRIHEAYDFLLRLRAQLHLQAGGKSDLLTFAAQAAAAPALGYADADTATASEKLMRDYFIRARSIQTFCRDFLEAAEERLKARSRKKKKSKIESLGGDLALRDYQHLILDGDANEVLEGEAGLMRVFECQYQFGCALSPELRAVVRSHLDRIDDAFRCSAKVRESFFRILTGKAGTAQTLHEMHELGFLGRYLPEFEPLTCFVQYDQYHRYTADEHTMLTLATLATLAALDELAYTRELRLQELAHLHKEMERTHLLRLALLLHDIGKARGPRHLHKSAAAVPEVTLRLGLPADEGKVVEFLVANHIGMNHTAERRDIEDPALISRFAEKMETVEQLRMLYLLSYADLQSVAPGIWNEWRGTLIHELYQRTLRLLEAGDAARLADREEEVVKQVELEARASASRIGEAEIRRHIREMPERYRVAAAPPQDILRHIELDSRLKEEEVPCLIDITHKRRLGHTSLTLVCHDRLGLFALIAGALAAFDIGILEAKVYTRKDGLVVDTFYVVDGEGKAVTDDALWDLIREVMSNLLEGRLELDELLQKNRKFLKLKKRSHFEVPTVMEYDLSVSEDATVLDVVTLDRHGLLFRIAGLLAEEGVSISRAKISTEGPRAIDTFYVTDADSRKIEDRARLREICDLLTEVLTEGQPVREGSN